MAYVLLVAILGSFEYEVPGPFEVTTVIRRKLRLPWLEHGFDRRVSLVRYTLEMGAGTLSLYHITAFDGPHDAAKL